MFPLSMCQLQAYLGIAVALSGSPWELATKALTVASVMQDYNQDMDKRIGRAALQADLCIDCLQSPTITHPNYLASMCEEAVAF